MNIELDQLITSIDLSYAMTQAGIVQQGRPFASHYYLHEPGWLEAEFMPSMMLTLSGFKPPMDKNSGKASWNCKDLVLAGLVFARMNHAIETEFGDHSPAVGGIMLAEVQENGHSIIAAFTRARTWEFCDPSIPGETAKNRRVEVDREDLQICRNTLF